MENQDAGSPDRKDTGQFGEVVIRFAGDSGDGIQLSGDAFTRAAALAGNDLATFPDFPAEIRAPAGGLAGVSGFQLHFSSRTVHTPGDAPDVLVAMNPAALKVNLGGLKEGGLLIVNSGSFLTRNLEKAGYQSNPLEDDSLAGYRLVALDMGRLTREALVNSRLKEKEKKRCKNYLVLGLLFWAYGRDPAPELKQMVSRFAARPDLAEANTLAFKAGYHLGETTDLFDGPATVPAAPLEPGTWRNIVGNEALALGLVAAATLAGKKLFLGTYPITPASDILHRLARFKHYDVTTFQAEDEIAGIGAALGAAYGGAIGVTTSSGPGITLKAEMAGLAAMIELPLVIVNVQRGGPSTGLPTKTEQADLLQAIHGRNGECPMPVLATRTPADCFRTALEAVRIAVKYVTPVMLLSDGYVANGSEPWRLPDVADLPRPEVQHRTAPENYAVYGRNPETLARDWVLPGTPGLEHRLGGIEKDFTSGEISYDPQNHERMVRIRQEKVGRVAGEADMLELHGEAAGEVLVIGWGGTCGSLRQAVSRLRESGRAVSHCHLRLVHPLPAGLDKMMAGFRQVLVCELNTGQLLSRIRAEYLVDAKGYQKVQGQPFYVDELCAAINRTGGWLA